MMPGYLAKRMPVSEWSPFRAAYERFFLARGAERGLALFIEHHQPSEEAPLVLVPDYLSDIVERMAPGGWHDLPAAPERRWTTLVGNRTALSDFGLSHAIE